MKQSLGFTTRSISAVIAARHLKEFLEALLELQHHFQHRIVHLRCTLVHEGRHARHRCTGQRRHQRRRCQRLNDSNERVFFEGVRDDAAEALQSDGRSDQNCLTWTPRSATKVLAHFAWQLRSVRTLEVARAVRLHTANTLDDGLQRADGVLHRAHLAFMGVFSERHRRYELVEVDNGILHFGHRAPVGRGVLHHLMALKWNTTSGKVNILAQLDCYKRSIAELYQIHSGERETKTKQHKPSPSYPLPTRPVRRAHRRTRGVQ